MSSASSPVTLTRFRGGNTDCAVAFTSELASRTRSTPAAPVDDPDRVADRVGAWLPDPEETAPVASANRVVLPTATPSSTRSVIVPNVMPDAAMASALVPSPEVVMP